MENQVQVFTSNQFGEVRTVEIDGELHFVAADVCRALEISNSRMAADRLDEDEKGVSSIDTLGGKQETTIVTESGLYSLVLGSRKPEAKAFKRWITHEVIPSIRKHGAYLTPAKLEEAMNDPDAWIKMLTTIKTEREKNAQLRTFNSNLLTQSVKQAPKVELAEAISEPDGSVLIRDFEKLLRKRGYQIKNNALYKWLRDEELIKPKYPNHHGGYTYGASKNALKNNLLCNRRSAGNAVGAAVITPKGQDYILNHIGDFANQQTEIDVQTKPSNEAIAILQLQSKLNRAGLRIMSYRGNWLYEFLSARKLIKPCRHEGRANIYRATQTAIESGWLVNRYNARNYISSAAVTPLGVERITEMVKKEA